MHLLWFWVHSLHINNTFRSIYISSTKFRILCFSVGAISLGHMSFYLPPYIGNMLGTSPYPTSFDIGIETERQEYMFAYHYPMLSSGDYMHINRPQTTAFVVCHTSITRFVSWDHSKSLSVLDLQYRPGVDCNIMPSISVIFQVKLKVCPEVKSPIHMTCDL